MAPSPTSIPPAFDMTNITGAMGPTTTPIPPQVLTLGEVRGPYLGQEYRGPDTTGQTTGTQAPNAVDIYNNPIYVDPSEFPIGQPEQVWEPDGKGGYQPFMSRSIWDAMSLEEKMKVVGTVEIGGAPSLSLSGFESVQQMPSQEYLDAMTQVFMDVGSTVNPEWKDPARAQAAAYSAILGLDFGSGATSSMDPYSAGMLDLNNRKFEFEQRQYQDELAYQQQALAQQAQQAADAAAAQRRAQAMALAESILGMQQQQWAQVSGWALPPGSETAPGWEQGGAVSQMFAKQGLPYTPIQAVQTPGVDYAPAYQWAQQLLGGS